MSNENKMFCTWCKKEIGEDQRHYSVVVNYEQRIDEEIEIFDSKEIAFFCSTKCKTCFFDRVNETTLPHKKDKPLTFKFLHVDEFSSFEEFQTNFLLFIKHTKLNHLDSFSFSMTNDYMPKLQEIQLKAINEALANRFGRDQVFWTFKYFSEDEPEVPFGVYLTINDKKEFLDFDSNLTIEQYILKRLSS